MAAPRRWGDGKVSLLVPSLSALWDIKTRAIGLDEYRERFVARLEPAEIGPGSLLADFDDGDEWEGIGSYPGRFVADGDTLCCACSRDEAAAGRCHRVWAAEALAAAGWRVVLDGVEVTP